MKNSFFKESTLIIQSILVGIGMSFKEMNSHKTRSVLSILGVLLGVASLVAMLTLVGGIDTFLNEKIGKWVGSVWIWKKWNPSQKEALEWSRSPGLKLSDGQYLKNNSSDVKAVPQSISRSLPILFNNKSEIYEIIGVDSSYIENEKDDMMLITGRWLNHDDFYNARSNCVVSWIIAKNIASTFHLKDSLESIDKTINIGQCQYTIVGIFGPVNQHNQPSQLKNRTFIPLQAMQKYETGYDPDPGAIQVNVKDARNIKVLSKKIARSLQEHHRNVEDFEYRTADFLDKITSMFNNISLLMTIISCLSLLIGGLSIMNVMLSSVSERIKEIGIRKALGANNLQIFVQFITETITLSLIGGSVGFIIGLTPLIFKDAISLATSGAIEPTILPLHVIFTFLVVTFLGILFGLYPAVKAARMNPVEALRYE